MEQEQQLVFGPFRLDPSKRKLWRETQEIALQPRPFAVLNYLVHRPGQVVTKEELLKQIWQGTYVTSTALKVSIRAIRKALGDDVNNPQYLETVGWEGYRFLGKVVRSQHSVVSRGKGTRNWKLGSGSLPLQSPNPKPQIPEPALVGRETEFTYLYSLLEKAVNGERQVVFVTGEPGIGKTTLVDAFLLEARDWRLETSHTFPQASSPKPLAPRWWVGRGQCIEQYGGGEAYLPVLEAMSHLCRSAEGEQVVTILTQYAPTWLVQMPALVSAEELERLQRKVAGATRERMLREMAEALEALAVERALVLVLEDLHWSDHSTLELIAYLARRRVPARLLVIGTYRPTDVVVHDHPLKGIKHELQVHRQCTELSLELLTEDDVTEYVAGRFNADTPESLSQLAQLIYRRTDGNALFMVSLVNELITQQVITQQDGRWQLAGSLVDSETLIPLSLRQFLEQQIDRLSPTERDVLEAASIIGMSFSAMAVSAALQIETTQAEEQCTEFARRGHFLRHSGVAEWPDGTVASCYQFTHAMYQEVLYGRAPVARRVELHRLVGSRQERAYGVHAKKIAAELAMHFERGREYRRAVFYLHQAGVNAIRRNAHHEAIRYLNKGLESLKVIPADRERAHQELSLQLTLGLPLAATRGYAAPEVEQVYSRALTLCEHIGETPLLFPALVGLWAFQMVRGKLHSALGVAAQGLRLAEQSQNPAFLLEAHLGLGMISYFVGDLSVARTHLEEGLVLASGLDRTGRIPTSVQDSEVGCLTYAASALWHLGYADQARLRLDEALALARKLAHPFSEVFVLTQGAGLHMLCGDLSTFRQWQEKAMILAQTQGFPLWLGLGTALNGWALIEQGQTKEGIAQVHQGLEIYHAIGTELSKSFFLLLLAEAYCRTGQTAEGFTFLTQAQTFIETTGERLFEAELYRLRGEILLTQEIKSQKSESPHPRAHILEPKGEAEVYLLKAIDIAQKQRAKWAELRAMMSLARLWQSQGKHHAARNTLLAVYNWFTEGFDTKDLQEAKALLAALAAGEA
jgi:DNA-binding winged helix-turn-helix (wHTH) protein/predicted ATPase